MNRSVFLVGATLAVFLFAGASSARARRGRTVSKAKMQLHWEAMQALYGVGLKIKRSRRSTTIAPKRGGLTQAKFNQYVEQVYLPALKAYSYFRKGPGFRFGSRETYKDPKFDTHAQTKLGFILLETYAKYKLCREINSMLGSALNMVESYRRQSWCAYQGMLEAIAPIFEYRGTTVTWKGPREKSDLKITDVIFRKDASGNYPIIVTVAGGGRWFTREGFNILSKLSEAVDSTFSKKLHRIASKLYKKELKAYHKFLKQVASKQRRLMRGKNIIFAKQRFYYMIVRQPATGPLPCNDTYFLAFVPKRRRRQGYHLGVEVNGVECAAHYMDPGAQMRGDLYGCDRYIKSGDNKVTVAVHYSLNAFNYKRREWRRHHTGRGYTRKTITYTKTRRGKRLYSRSITCTK